jgi:hypothetical protein
MMCDFGRELYGFAMTPTWFAGNLPKFALASENLLARRRAVLVETPPSPPRLADSFSANVDQN